MARDERALFFVVHEIRLKPRIFLLLVMLEFCINCLCTGSVAAMGTHFCAQLPGYFSMNLLGADDKIPSPREC